MTHSNFDGDFTHALFIYLFHRVTETTPQRSGPKKKWPSEKRREIRKKEKKINKNRVKIKESRTIPSSPNFNYILESHNNSTKFRKSTVLRGNK